MSGLIVLTNKLEKDMNIENLEEAQELGTELKRLAKARGFILDGGVVKACNANNYNQYAEIEDSEIKEKLADAITRRIEDIHNRIKEL